MEWLNGSGSSTEGAGARDCLVEKGNSMSIKEVSAEKLAEPQRERSRLVAAARLTLLESMSTVGKKKHGWRYFAKPGEAEWGC